MRERFCERSFDLHIYLTPEEVAKIKRLENVTPVTDVPVLDGDIVFHLINPENEQTLSVKCPHSPSNPNYWVRIGDQALQNLLDQGIIETRYGNSSKIKIVLEEVSDKVH